MRVDEVISLDDKYIFFWGGPYSQWIPSEFIVDGITYNCAEQYMMAEKARLFKDEQALRIIMNARDPATQKATGRRVQNFDQTEWEKIARLVVYRGTLAKFTQNRELLAELLDSRDKIIVEASPYDTIWGIGLSEDDPKRFNESEWRGTNWLGEAIMQVRSDLRQLADETSDR
jgi:ribA/ribD-fused uncharacterized protein